MSYPTRRPQATREQAQELEWFRWLADAVAVLHFSYLGYVVVGGYLACWLRKTFPLHALAVAWALAVVGTPLNCPLTSLQNALLVRGGEPSLPGTFQQTYLHEFYPARFQSAVYVMAALLVAASWAILARTAASRSPRRLAAVARLLCDRAHTQAALPPGRERAAAGRHRPHGVARP